jgi:hypothetical protein
MSRVLVLHPFREKLVWQWLVKVSPLDHRLVRHIIIHLVKIRVISFMLEM